jgi:hypothetical protein
MDELAIISHDTDLVFNAKGLLALLESLGLNLVWSCAGNAYLFQTHNTDNDLLMYMKLGQSGHSLLKLKVAGQHKYEINAWTDYAVTPIFESDDQETQFEKIIKSGGLIRISGPLSALHKLIRRIEMLDQAWGDADKRDLSVVVDKRETVNVGTLAGTVAIHVSELRRRHPGALFGAHVHPPTL